LKVEDDGTEEASFSQKILKLLLIVKNNLACHNASIELHSKSFNSLMRCIEIRKLDLKRNSDYIILTILLYNLSHLLKIMGRNVDSLLFLQKAMTIYENNSSFCKMGLNVYDIDFIFSCMYLNSNAHIGLNDRYLMKSYGDHIKYAIKADIYQAYMWQC